MVVEEWLEWDGNNIYIYHFRKRVLLAKDSKVLVHPSLFLALNHTPISKEFYPSPHSTRPLLFSTSLYAPLYSYFQPCTILVFVIISRKVTRYIQTLLLEPKMVKLLKLGGGVSSD